MYEGSGKILGGGLGAIAGLLITTIPGFFTKKGRSRDKRKSIESLIVRMGAGMIGGTVIGGAIGEVFDRDPIFEREQEAIADARAEATEAWTMYQASKSGQTEENK